MSDIQLDPSVIAPKLPPWDINGWSSQERHSVYRSWALRYAQTRNFTVAMHYFDKCIHDIDNNKAVAALCMRSKFKREIAQPQEALEDGKIAGALAPGSALVNLQIADSLYDLNRFEDNKLTLHNSVRHKVGMPNLQFEQRLLCVNNNFQDNVGASLGPFFLKYSSKISSIHGEMLKPTAPEETIHHSKIAWNDKECDVESVVAKPVKRISPLDAARSQRKTKIFYQNYLNGAWTDVAFLKALRQNPIVLLDKYNNSASERRNHLNGAYERVEKFTRMLHARSPIYNAVHRRCSNPEVLERFHQANIYRIQYQTRRNMLSILRNVRDLRAQQDTVGLRKLVSKVMGEYNVLKTKRVMPWQMNFMIEVYNHLALSLCESFRMPTYRVSPYDKDAMCRLLGVQVWKLAEPQSIVFGNRATYAYEDSGTAFEEAKESRRTISGLSKRLHFARLPMERSYLLHELADIHLSHNHLVQCLDYAKRSVEEARSANSKIWEFLATMLEVKVYAILGKYERLADVLNIAYNLAMDLKSTNLCTFIEFCRMLNTDFITLRKISILMANKRRQKTSSRSSYNTSLQGTSNTDLGVDAINVA